MIILKCKPKLPRKRTVIVCQMTVKMNVLEYIPSEIILLTIEYLELPSIYAVSLTCSNWFSLIHSSQHVWKMLFNYYSLSYHVPIRSSTDWKQEVKSLVGIRFVSLPNIPGSYKLSNSNRTLHNHSPSLSWNRVKTNKIIDLKQNAGRFFCFEVVLDYMEVDCNYFYVVVGVHFWDRLEVHYEPGLIVGFGPNGIGFFCGNQVVKRSGRTALTQDSTDDNSWPSVKIRSGDVVGVKIKVSNSGNAFDIDFYLNGVKRRYINRINNDININIEARFVQPMVSVVCNSIITLQNAVTFRKQMLEGEHA